MNRISKCMLAAAVLAVAADGFAQDQMQSPAVHAKRGQSSAQQSRDSDSCTAMARKRTGVDPTVLAANSTPLQEGKGLTVQPIDQPTMAMGSSSGGATGAGTGDMSQGQMGNAGAGNAGQMGSSGAGATGSSGQMNNAEAGAMGSSGSSATGATGSSGMSGSSASSADMGSSGSSGAMGSTGASGATGGSGHAMASSGSSKSSGTTGAGHAAGKSGGKLAMVTADDYNAAFSKCMSSRGYTVEGSASGN